MTNTNKTKGKGVETVENQSKDTTKDAKKMKLPFFRKLHIHPLYLALGLVATILVVFFARVGIWEHNYLAAMEGSPRDVVSKSESLEINEGSNETEEVDNTEPTQQQITEYIVAPNKPRYFSIPYLGIYNRRIVELGLKGEGEMATPYNAYDVGWYTGAGSVVPGERGVSVMNAHGGDLGYGIFRTLPKLPIGETVKIEMGDGRVFTYHVVESVKKMIGDEANNYMSTAFTPLDSTGNTLTLITCTGDWLQTSWTYNQRLFVRAILE